VANHPDFGEKPNAEILVTVITIPSNEYKKQMEK
jgi:hypothetical protein